MEPKYFVSVGLALIVGIFIGAFFFGTGGTTGNVSLNDYECKQTTQQAQYEVIGDKECVGKKGFLGRIDTECSIQIKNLADQPADFGVSYECFTVENSNNPQVISSTKKPLSSNHIETFVINYDSNGREFNCKLNTVDSSKVSGCFITKK